MKIVVIVGHPDPSAERLNRALADSYALAAAAARHDVRRVDVASLNFPILRTREDFYGGSAPEGVRAAQSDIAWADHLAFFFPLWMGDVPALFKAFIEQTFRPGFAVDVARKRKLLTSKTARLIVTMGMPAIVYRAVYRAHMLKSLKRDLAMCGITAVGETLIGGVEDAREWKRRRWLRRMASLARGDGRRRSARLRASRLVIGGGLIASSAYLGYVARAWMRFGAHHNRSALLDAVMPDYDVRLYHEIFIGAPAALTFDTFVRSSLERSLIVQALFRIRQIILRGKSEKREVSGGLLEDLKALGWRIVGERPNCELVFAAVTKPWQADPTFVGVDADEFARFHEPGYVKIAFTLRIDPNGEEASIARSETRATATDYRSRARFRRYWAFLSPGIEMIRIVLLAQLKADAQACYRQAGRQEERAEVL